MAHVVRVWLAAIASVLLVAGCGGSARPLNLPAPIESTTMGEGDVFELHVVGEEKLPVSYTVAPDGTCDVPYIKRIKVSGLEPQELAATIRAKLMEGQILTDPSVSVSVKEYNSKKIEVLGQVQRPGSIPLQPGMKLLRAIAIAGGFNMLADKGHVVIRRRVKGETKAATISVVDIMDNKIPDPPLQAGDSINVAERVF